MEQNHGGRGLGAVDYKYDDPAQSGAQTLPGTTAQAAALYAALGTASGSVGMSKEEQQMLMAQQQLLAQGVLPGGLDVRWLEPCCGTDAVSCTGPTAAQQCCPGSRPAWIR